MFHDKIILEFDFQLILIHLYELLKLLKCLSAKNSTLKDPIWAIHLVFIILYVFVTSDCTFKGKICCTIVLIQHSRITPLRKKNNY